MIGWNERTGTTFSTTGLIDLEQAVVDLAENGLSAGVGVAVERAVEGAVETRPSISDEQAAVVTEMCTSGRAVEVLVAAAGHRQDVQPRRRTRGVAAQRPHGHRLRVVGVRRARAPGGSGIRSTTIAMLNLDIHQRPQASRLAHGAGHRRGRHGRHEDPRAAPPTRERRWGEGRARR